jgi:hypothetical protein
MFDINMIRKNSKFSLAYRWYLETDVCYGMVEIYLKDSEGKILLRDEVL